MPCAVDWTKTGSLTGAAVAGIGTPETASANCVARPRNPVVITDFDPAEDILVVAMDDSLAEAHIDTRPTRDRRGTDVLLNGLRVATVRNCPRLSPADIGQILL